MMNLVAETAVLTLMIAVVKMTTRELRFNDTMTGTTTRTTVWTTDAATMDVNKHHPMATTTSFQPIHGFSRSAGAKMACILLVPFLPDPPTHLK